MCGRYLTFASPHLGLPQALSSIQMIIICVGTDVLPALSLVREMPEADLLLRKPRNRKKDRLANARLICHAYFFIGVLESLTAMAGYDLLLVELPQRKFLIVTPRIELSTLASNAMASRFPLYG